MHYYSCNFCRQVYAVFLILSYFELEIFFLIAIILFLSYHCISGMLKREITWTWELYLILQKILDVEQDGVNGWKFRFFPLRRRGYIYLGKKDVSRCLGSQRHRTTADTSGCPQYVFFSFRLVIKPEILSGHLFNQ